MLWKTRTLKIARSSPRNSVFIGHASNPPYGLGKVKLKLKWPGRLEKTQI
jgi:hypothetical protein